MDLETKNEPRNPKKTVKSYLAEIVDDFRRFKYFSILDRGIFDKAEIGFRLDPAFQGQGIMTRALEVVLDQAISVYRLYRVEARTASYNAVSQRVLEKAGFEYIGKWRAYFNFDGVRHDCWLYEKIIGG